MTSLAHPLAIELTFPQQVNHRFVTEFLYWRLGWCRLEQFTYSYFFVPRAVSTQVLAFVWMTPSATMRSFNSESKLMAQVALITKDALRSSIVFNFNNAQATKFDGTTVNGAGADLYDVGGAASVSADVYGS
ncbi:hypothetical protein JOM56_010907 [Amanita muscaria]